MQYHRCKEYIHKYVPKLKQRIFYEQIIQVLIGVISCQEIDYFRDQEAGECCSYVSRYLTASSQYMHRKLSIFSPHYERRK